jgi:hypothetical protein
VNGEGLLNSAIDKEKENLFSIFGLTKADPSSDTYLTVKKFNLESGLVLASVEKQAGNINSIVLFNPSKTLLVYYTDSSSKHILSVLSMSDLSVVREREISESNYTSDGITSQGNMLFGYNRMMTEMRYIRLHNNLGPVQQASGQTVFATASPTNTWTNAIGGTAVTSN